MTLANWLTLTRLFISPLFLFLYLEHEMLHISMQVLPYVLLILLALSELSDLIDGYIARRFNQVTDFGKIFDPMADSIAHISMFLTFTMNPVKIPLLLVFVFLYRDTLISTLRTICALKGYALAARPSGKLKTAIQGIVCVLIVILMIPYSLGIISQETLSFISTSLVACAAIYTLISGVDYLIANKAYLRKIFKPKRHVVDT